MCFICIKLPELLLREWKHLSQNMLPSSSPQSIPKFTASEESTCGRMSLHISDILFAV